MLVLQVTKNLRTGDVTEGWVEMADVSTTASPEALARVQAEANSETIRQQAEQALVDLRTYRDRANPTAAQTTAAVKLLCRVAIGLIRLHLRRLDATD